MTISDTKQRILDAATALVHVRGFGATSVGDILKAAGVTKGTLYHYFESKDDLGLEILRRDREAFMAFLDQAFGVKDPEEALDRFFTAALCKHGDTGFTGGCLWGNTALEMSDANPEYTALVREVFDEWIGKIGKVIAAGQKAGVFRTDREAHDLAHVVVSAVEGGIMLSRLSKSDEPFRACLDSLRAMLKNTGSKRGSCGRKVK